MRFVCPKSGCGRILEKARLDVYWCDVCNHAWLIHKLSSYKTFEEASRRKAPCLKNRDIKGEIS